MTTVIYYEKPGCAINTRQKKLLEAAGQREIGFDPTIIDTWLGLTGY